METHDPQESDKTKRSLRLNGRGTEEFMKIVHVNILLVILFSTTLVPFSYAAASCCDPGAGCCSTTNVSGGLQPPRTFSGAPSQARARTANKPSPQVNPMPWSATVNQIGNPQRLGPGTGCCPETNTTNGRCGSEPQSALHPRPGASTITEIFAFNPSLGNLW
jgi:hypothetical protein